MHYVNATVLNASDATSQTGSSIDSNQLIAASFQLYFTDGTADGSFEIQASNDLTPLGNFALNFTPSNWTTIPNTMTTVTAGSTGLVTLSVSAYRFLRVVYTSTTPGTGNVVVNMFGLSN